MAYKLYSEQILAHVRFLQLKGFDITELKVNAGFIRCQQLDKHQRRGKLAYKTRIISLHNGLTGMQTWYRGLQGETSNFQTYGMGPQGNENVLCTRASSVETRRIAPEQHDIAGRKAYGFWQHSDARGRSEYLEQKKVGYYGIRFRSSHQYGDVAVIPMVDASGRLWNYQLLNPDGTKRHLKDARCEGLFHMIGVPTDGKPIGVAESYVTAASCFELTGITTACAFSCQNLKNITSMLNQCYPQSKLIIFADNDKHLEMRGAKNQGVIKGEEAVQAVDGAILVKPYFDPSEVSKRLSDWNDLIHQRGVDYAKAQIKEQLKANGL